MSFEEIAALIRNEDTRKKDDWEKVRQLCFYSVVAHTDKINKPSDLFRFPWEEKEKPVSKKPIERVRKEAQKVEKYLEKKIVNGK